MHVGSLLSVQQKERFNQEFSQDGSGLLSPDVEFSLEVGGEIM
jgi:hypothetical protein